MARLLQIDVECVAKFAFVRGNLSKRVFFIKYTHFYNDIADEIFRIREMKQKNFTDTAVRDEQVKRINELNEFIEQQDSELTEFDESLARRWLKEIVVWDERFSVELKSGVIVNIVV